MTTFLTTENLETHNTRYYVDDKRVSPEDFDFNIAYCRRKDMNYNVSQVYVKGKYRRFIFHYN